MQSSKKQASHQIVIRYTESYIHFIASQAINGFENFCVFLNDPEVYYLSYMDNASLVVLQYPIGKFEVPALITEAHRSQWISALENLPKRLEKLVCELDEAQLDTPYRTNGWTVRQVVHHLSDSHHHSYTRFKWALTEDNPVIKPYFEKEWANLFDTRTAPIQMSIYHLKAIHFKLVYLLNGLSESQLQRTFIHPDGNEISTVEANMGRYAWHGNHHYAHIQSLKQRMGW